MDGRHAHGAAGRVWDPFVRMFHWAVVAAFAAAWMFRGEASVHENAGRLVLAAVVARVAWGIAGPASARFATFVKGPVKTLSYLVSILRGAPERHVGHNPAGAAMIVALLAALVITCASGLLMTTTALWGNALIENVHAAAAWVSLALVAGHLVGVAAAVLQHRENLPLSMVTGRKLVAEGTPPFLGPARTHFGPWLASAGFVAAASLLWFGAHTGLNASYWRMDRIVVAHLAANGCKEVRLAGPRIEIWPDRRLVYAVTMPDSATAIHVAVPFAKAVERRPDLTGAFHMPPCRTAAKTSAPVALAAPAAVSPAIAPSPSPQPASMLASPPVPKQRRSPNEVRSNPQGASAAPRANHRGRSVSSGRAIALPRRAADWLDERFGRATRRILRAGRAKLGAY